MIRIVLLILLGCRLVTAQDMDAHWATAAKNGFGTSVSLSSKVWFTLANGVMTEVFYPTVDLPNVQTLQLYVDTGGRIETEIDSTHHRLEVPNPAALTFRQINTAKNGAYTITKTYVTDPRRNTVLIDVDVSIKSGSDARVYVQYDPSINNSGWHDDTHIERNGLIAFEKDIASALIPSCGFHELSMKVPTNLIQTFPLNQNRCTLALSFAKTPDQAVATARASLARGFSAVRREYEAEWQRYVATLPRFANHQRQFNMAAMVLKGLEDKTYRGAVIASPSTPWGGGPNSNEPNTTGYHAVWSRDLYHVATALESMGDRAGANRLFDYLFNVQQKPDGSFPQNSWVDGRPIGNGLQMDQVALPLVLAYQLKRHDRKTWLKHIKPAADFILNRGPRTDQDRWEEKSGYSPSSIAAQIAGLICAANVATRHQDSESAFRYLKTADLWRNELVSWTVTTSGPHGDGNYFLRLTENGKPNDADEMEINSGGGRYDQRSIVDAGFLEFVSDEDRHLGASRAGEPCEAGKRMGRRGLGAVRID